MQTAPSPKRSIFDILVGKDYEFSLENRFFNGTCIFLFALLCLFIPINFFLEFPELTGILILCMPILISMYYYARFKKMFKVSVWLMGAIMQGLLVLNFIFSEGTRGPTLIYFFLVAALTTPISTKRLQIIWLASSFLLIILLISVEIWKPEWILVHYPSESFRHIDLLAAMLISIVIIYLNTQFILNNYAKEKSRADKINQELLHSNEQLAASNQQKDMLFSLVSHDFRSPLASLQQTLDLLVEMDIDQRQRTYLLKEMQTQLKHTYEMVNNMLHWANAQMKKSELSLSALYIRQEIDIAIRSVQSIAEKKRIHIHVDIPDNERCLADKEMLQVIIRNLIVNAIKFSHSNSHLLISLQSKEGIQQILFRDNGTGIPAEKAAKLFTFQAQSTFGTKREKGMGLGLYLSKQFAERQNGSLFLLESSEKGSVFSLELPGIKD